MTTILFWLGYLIELVLVPTTCLDGWVALEEWKLSLTSAKVEVEVEAELDNSVFMKTANSSRI